MIVLWIYGDMSSDKDKHQEKIDKRAAALRENLKKRKAVAKQKQQKNKDKDQ